jgi:hypothetical protein
VHGGVGVERRVERAGPDSNTTMPAAKTQTDGAADSPARASAMAAVPAATIVPVRTRGSSRPVSTLAATDADTPTISSSPSRPSGWCQLSRINGHSRPRVELGTATLR